MKPPSITLGDYVVIPVGRPDPEGCYAWKLRGPGATGNVTRSFQPDARPHIEDKARTWLEGQGLIECAQPKAKPVPEAVKASVKIALRATEAPPLPPRAPMPEPAPARPRQPAVVEDVPVPPPVASALIARSVHDEVLAELARTRAALAAAEGKLVEAEADAAALDLIAEALDLDRTTATGEKILGTVRGWTQAPTDAAGCRALAARLNEQAAQLLQHADILDRIAALEAEDAAEAAVIERAQARRIAIAEQLAAARSAS